jgi:SAM-dependent methyltransferase
MAVVPRDPAGFETLEIMQQAPRYNAWQYDRVAPYLGQSVCEIGSGVGNISSHLVDGSSGKVVLTDTDPYYLDVLHTRFGSCPRVAVEPLTLPDPGAAERFRRYALDTIVALNVLEHIADDLGALKSMAELLPRGGRIVLLVPAVPSLYGSLDRELGHCRRYSKAVLAARMQQAGFAVNRLFYFSLVGACGWWLNAKVLRRSRISTRQLRTFDRLVPLLRNEDRWRLPWGQSLVAVGTVE